MPGRQRQAWATQESFRPAWLGHSKTPDSEKERESDGGEVGEEKEEQKEEGEREGRRGAMRERQGKVLAVRSTCYSSGPRFESNTRTVAHDCNCCPRACPPVPSSRFHGHRLCMGHAGKTTVHRKQNFKLF